MKCFHNKDLPEIEKNSSHLSEKYEGKTNLVLIGSYYETEEFMKDNEYIKNGYRINCDSLWKCLKSLFVIHNESINIWSHLLGSIFMFFLIFYTMIFITSYKTQINIINFDFENIKKYAEPLLNSNNSQLNNFKKLFINFTQEFKKEIKMNFNNFNPINFYTNSLEKLNNSLNYLKRNTNTSFNLKEYFDNINERLLDFKEQMLDMMEIENIPINNEKFLKYKNKNLKRFPLFIILSSAILCLIFSVFFHLIGIISKNYYKILSKFDYAGISLLIAGSCYPPYYYFFYCSNFLRNFYLTFITTFGV
jgi:adiponectin receptor